MFLSQVESDVLRMCEDVVGRPHTNRTDTHGEFARISHVSRDSFPEGTFQ